MKNKPTYAELERENHILREQLKSNKNKEVFSAQIQQLSKFGSWRMSIDPFIITLSPNSNTILGNEAKEISLPMSKFIISYIVSEDYSLLKEKTKIIMRNQHNKNFSDSFIHRITTSKGELKYLKVVYHLESENVIRGISIDITDLKKTELALQKSESKITSILHAMDDMVFILDEKNRFKSFYAPEQELYISPDEFIGKTHAEVMPKEINALMEDALISVKQGKTASYEYTLNVKKDIMSWYSIKLSPIFDQGAYTGVVAVIRDITKQKKTQLEIKKLSVAIEQSANTIVITNPDGNIEYTNPTFTELTGYTTEEALGENPHILNAGTLPDIYFAKMWETLSKGATWKGEFHNKKKDGELYWEQGTITPIKNDKGEITNYLAIKENITDRKKTEQALFESEKKFRELFEKSGDANLILENGKFVDCNNSTLNMLKYNSKQELLNVHPSIISPKYQTEGNDSFAEAEKMMKLAIKNGTHRFEWIHKKHDGQVFPCEVLLTSILKTPDKSIIHAVLTDISSRKKAEEELIRAKEEAERNEVLFRAISEQSAEGITVADTNGKYIFINPAFSQMSGYSKEELEKLTVFDMKADKQTHNSFTESSTIMEGIPTKVNLKKKTGEEYITEIIGKRISVENKTLILGTIRDITEKVKKEQELINALDRAERSEEQFRAIVDQSPLSIQIFDKEGLTIHLNNSWENIWQTSKDVSLYKYNVLEDEYAEKAGWLNYIRRAFNGEIVFLPDMEFDPKSNGLFGIKRTLKCIAFPIKIRYKVEQVVLIHQDITELKKNQEDLVKAKEKAEEGDRLKSAFLANMSHEIRTPMNGIMGFTSLLKDPDCTHDEQLDYIEIIEKSGYRLLGIINDLIDISKIESGLMEVHSSEISVNEQMKFMYTFFNPEVITKGLSLKLQELPEDQIIISDHEKFLAILTNLIKNSIKYSNTGIIDYGYTIKKDHLEFFVKDQGIGIPKTKLNSIFDRFVQADNSLASSFEGAGLGLSITKAFVELLGGKIWVKSELGKGTEFYFTHPLKK